MSAVIMTENEREYLKRLQAMIEPDQQIWDLSPNDVEALKWAVSEITYMADELREMLDITS